MANIYKVVETKELPASIADGMAVYGIARTDGKKGKSGLAAVMPAISESVFSVILHDQTGKDWLYGQVASLRGKLASEANKAGLAIDDETIGVTNLIKAMTVEQAAARVSKEAIGEWFLGYMAPLIGAALESKGVPQGVAAKVLVDFGKSFAKLATPEITFPQGESEQLTKAFALIGDDSETASMVLTEKLMARLEAAIARSADFATGGAL